jgi:uncharacterized protein (UPF0305 family)
MFRPDIAAENMQTEISCVAAELKTITHKGTLGKALAREVSRYSLLDLSLMGGRLVQSIQYIPPSYLEKIKPYLYEQFFGAQHRLIKMSRENRFSTMTTPIRDLETYAGYWDMVAQASFIQDGQTIPHGNGKEALGRFYYYLLAAFMMFVMEEPGHPVGTPFPGGYTVHKMGDTFVCYIRDKEKDVQNSICNYCPAIAGE